MIGWSLLVLVWIWWLKSSIWAEVFFKCLPYYPPWSSGLVGGHSSQVMAEAYGEWIKVIAVKDWDLNWQTATFNPLIKTSYVAIPNINNVGKYTHLQCTSPLQSHMSKSKDGERKEKLKTVVHSYKIKIKKTLINCSCRKIAIFLTRFPYAQTLWYTHMHKYTHIF